MRRLERRIIPFVLLGLLDVILQIILVWYIPTHSPLLYVILFHNNTTYINILKYVTAICGLLQALFILLMLYRIIKKRTLFVSCLIKPLALLFALDCGIFGFNIINLYTYEVEILVHFWKIFAIRLAIIVLTFVFLTVVIIYGSTNKQSKLDDEAEEYEHKYVFII